MIFIQNGLGKIFSSEQADKIVKNDTFFIIVGIILLIAVALFLINKTMLLGTIILAIYMVFISFIHWYKGKPFEVVILIIMGTIFAAYLRQPELFHKRSESY